MHFSTASLVSLMVSSVAVAHVVRRSDFGCGTPEPSEAHLEMSRQMALEEAAAKESGGLYTRATIEVPTWFHVVAASTSLQDGYVTDKMLSDQLNVMNENYAAHGISFVSAGTTRTINSNWASDGAELAMKKNLRSGDYATLNVYFLKDVGGNLGLVNPRPKHGHYSNVTSYCYFPDSVTEGSDDFYLDGCSILYSSVPGGSSTNFNLGKTVTHEVGHWFGLYHTFQGGCSAGGDRIADTPAQASASSGCPEGRDSCPNQAGADPIHNYMDYSYDSCYEEFTDDQQARMYNMWNTYRA